MADLQNDNSLEHFAILTPRLIILPTPIAVSFTSYRNLYSELHADDAFCEMAFGHHFPARKWNDAETRDVIESRDIEISWKKRGLGDFAVGLRESLGPTPPKENVGCVMIKKDDIEQLGGPDNERLGSVEWVGYVGVRDATTTSIPSNVPQNMALPPWCEMVELRYGISSQHWGNGIAMEAAKAVMQWAAEERGVERFIAETEKGNKGSARVLQKLGFVLSGTNYWDEVSEIEWEHLVAR